MVDRFRSFYSRITGIQLLSCNTGGVKALAEPAVSRRKQFLRLGPPTLVAEEPREAGRRAQFPRYGLLALRGLDGVSITLLRAPILRTRRRHV